MKRMIKSLTEYGEDLLDLFFPRLCPVCGATLLRGEEILCLTCRASLPVTRLYLHQPNMIHERLMSLRCPVRRASSYFYYHRENPYARLIHDTKYNGRPRIGKRLASEHALQLKSVGFFEGVDAIQPIPIHWLKRIRRTYNQSEEIASGIADATGLPVIDNLIAGSYHTSQTKKSAEGRKVNARGSFRTVRSTELQDKHILLVDDVITTGATMIEAIETLITANKSVTLSVFSLALTSNS